MRSFIRSVAAVCLFVSFSTSASAKAYDKCTPEQEAAFKPYKYDDDALGCDTETFETCSESCLKMYETAVQHAPDCCPSYLPREYTSYHELATLRLDDYKEVRGNSTNKYFPQAVSGAPKCTTQVFDTFSGVITSDKCFLDADSECSDVCLQTIEKHITTAPFCVYSSFSIYTLGENSKSYLVKCLNARNQSLSGNHVLTTIVTAREAQSSSSAILFSTGAAIASAIAVIMLS